MMVSEADDRKSPLAGLISDITNCDCRDCWCVGLVDLDNRREVNLWNCWQGDTSAQLMVIGQDFGNADTQPASVEEMRTHVPWVKAGHGMSSDVSRWCPTDRTLYNLFLNVMGVDLTVQKRLYFTNMVCCYRAGKTSGEDKRLDQWLACCAHRHMGRLLRHIRPKAVIVLGQRTFEALHYCEGATVSRNNNAGVLAALEQGLTGFQNAMNFDYSIMFAGDPLPPIRVFPVYHPEYYAHTRDGNARQVAAWEAIRDKLNRIDKGILLELQ